jgi:membrane protein required for beta-lactamase induction
LALLFCLGPKDLQRQVQGFIDAWDEDDEKGAKLIGNEITDDCTPNENASYGQTIALGILKQSYLRTFSILFWFIILGPIGAILYRSSHTLKQTMPGMSDLGLDFRSGVNRLLYLLDWVPVRITAFTYALSGNFHDATYKWWNSHNDKESDSADSILSKAGSGALGLEKATSESEEPAVDAEMAQALTLRSLTIWIGVLALISITNWIS